MAVELGLDALIGSPDHHRVLTLSDQGLFSLGPTVRPP